MTKLQQVGVDSKGFFEFFDCPCLRQGVEDLREVYITRLSKYTKGQRISPRLVEVARFLRLNIKKLDGNIVQKHGGSKQVGLKQLGSKQVGFKQLGPGVETGVHEVHDEKRVWFEVELQGSQGDREAEVFQVSNDDTTVAQRRLEDKQPEEKTNTDCLIKEQENEYQTGWKIKTEDTTRSTYLVNMSPSSAIGFKKPIDMLKFFGWLASIEQGVLEPVKVKCIFLEYHESIVGNKLWRLDDITSKVVLYRNMGFNESGEYKKIFISSGVGIGSMQVLQGVEFEVEPQEDHTFEVEPHGNVDHDGSQEVQTQDLMDYQLARDREQHLTYELFEYREDSNEVISRWKAGLKEDLDVRSDVYVLSNGCRKSSDDSHDYYWEYAPVGSQEYQVVCTRPDIASTSVDMLDGFDRGSLKANLQHMEALSTTEARYMTFTEAWKKEIWLKGLLTASRYELRLVACIATCALVKDCSQSEVPAQVKVVAYRY
ncbi:hypothetical protein Tco_0790103 [Tanacetum coccineum]